MRASIENALQSKLLRSGAKVDAGQRGAAANVLRAFIHQGEAQSGKKIAAAGAAALASHAEERIADLA